MSHSIAASIRRLLRMSSNLLRNTTTIKRAVPFCPNSLRDLDLMRLKTCDHPYNPTSSENGEIRELLAGRCVGVIYPMKQNRFLRHGLQKRTSASSSRPLPKPAMIESLTTDKPSGWHISNTSPSVVRCCAEMLNTFLGTIRKPFNTTENDDLPH